MRALYCAAGLLVTFACASGQESHPLQTLAILFQFDHPYANRALAETQRELDTLIKGADVKLEWHDRSHPQPGSSFPNIVVLDFQGSCDPRSKSIFEGPLDGWLARMHISDGVVLPFGEVNCDLIRALMSDGTQKDKPSDKGFGRAMARVLAHELYHFITQSTEHAALGLIKPSFSRKDLELGGLSLDRQELSQLAKSMLLQ
jgi:hypothetical protein